jgi:hypothetical protein
LIFSSQAHGDGIEVRFQRETIWLTQRLMAKLFDCSTDNISLHLKNIFKENELDENSVTEDFSVTASDGINYQTKHYNLDAIIAVGSLARCRFSGTVVRKTEKSPSPNGTRYFTT